MFRETSKSERSLLFGFDAIRTYIKKELPPEMAQKYIYRVDEQAAIYHDHVVRIVTRFKCTKTDDDVFLCTKVSDVNPINVKYFEKLITLIGDELISIAEDLIKEEDEYIARGGE